MSLGAAEFSEKEIGAGPATTGETESPGGRTHRHPVARFVARRVLAGLATLLVASALIFVATNALPGNVAQVVLGRYATPARLQTLQAKLDLNQPLVVRYVHWLGDAVTGNLGQSAVQLANGQGNASVWPIIRTPLRNSVILALGTIILLIPLSLLAGTAAAVRAGKPTDYVLSYSALIVGSLPEFVVGTFLIAVFFSWLNVLPPVALVPPGASPLSNTKALALPILTLLAVSLAFSARQVPGRRRRGVETGLRDDGSARRGARTQGSASLRAAKCAGSQRANVRPVDPVPVRGHHRRRVSVQLPRHWTAARAVGVRARFTLIQGITLVLAALYIAINIAADLVVVFLVPKLRTSLR